MKPPSTCMNRGGNASYGLRQIPEGAESVSGRSAGFARVRSWALRKASKGFTRKTTGGVSGAMPRTSYLTSSKRCPGISINSRVSVTSPKR